MSSHTTAKHISLAPDSRLRSVTLPGVSLYISFQAFLYPSKPSPGLYP